MVCSTVTSLIRFAAETAVLVALSTSTRLDAMVDRVSGGQVNRAGLSGQVGGKAISYLEKFALRSNILGKGAAEVIPLLAQATREYGAEMTRALLRQPDFVNTVATSVRNAVPNIMASASAWSVRQLLTLNLVKHWAASGECRPLVNLTAQTICTGLSASNALISALPLDAMQLAPLIPDLSTALPSLPTNVPLPCVEDIGLGKAADSLSSVRLTTLTDSLPNVSRSPVASLPVGNGEPPALPSIPVAPLLLKRQGAGKIGLP